MLMDRSPLRSDDGAHRERGAVLVEFGFVAILMYLLMSATIDFGRLFYSAQAVQDCARATARELSVIPLPAGMTLEQALADSRVRQRVFQREHVVIYLENIRGGLRLQTFLDSLPVLNQMIRPLMIFDRTGDRRLLRYPGALLTDGSTPSGFTVGIPYIEARAADGTETITWVPIVEEIRNPNFPGESPFSLNTPAGMPQRGLVAIRINYPYQASMLSGFRRAPEGPLAPNVAYRIQANDGGVTETNQAPGGIVGGGEAGPYAGAYGLGKMYSHAEEVRPFRKLLSAQAIFRREVFD
jgi:hypothetical protein